MPQGIIVRLAQCPKNESQQENMQAIYLQSDEDKYTTYCGENQHKSDRLPDVREADYRVMY